MTEDIDRLGIGTRVEHDRYGEGFVCRQTLTAYEIIFERGGKISFGKANILTNIRIRELVEDTEPRVTLKEVMEAFTDILDFYTDIVGNTEISERWRGGTMLLKPVNPVLQAKEIPLDVFFHKIVMVRDKLRVLEQNINSSALNEDEKINIQKYITGVYGSLTTFNTLFKNRKDYFVGAAKKSLDEKEIRIFGENE